jgi:hypothetical protein
MTRDADMRRVGGVGWHDVVGIARCYV